VDRATVFGKNDFAGCVAVKVSGTARYTQVNFGGRCFSAGLLRMTGYRPLLK